MSQSPTLPTAQTGRPLPDFVKRKIGESNQPSSIQAADLSQVDASYRPYYEQFNATLGQLAKREEMSRQEAARSQDLLARNLERGLTVADQQRQSQLDQARMGNQDSQTQNRIRARAIGGAPSSAFLELANKTDQATQKNMFNTNSQYSNRVGELEDKAYGDLNEIETSLLKAIDAIESDRSLSLRQRDQAVESAKQQAAARALAARQAGGYGYGGYGGEQGGYAQEGGNVLGASTQGGGQTIAVDGSVNQDPLLAAAQQAHNLSQNSNPALQRVGGQMNSGLTGMIQQQIGTLSRDPRYKNLLAGRGMGGGAGGGY